MIFEKLNKLRMLLLPVMLFAFGNVGAVEYWGDDARDDIGGRVVSQEMRTYPVLSGRMSVDSQIITGDSLYVNISMDMQWLNYRRYGSSSIFQSTACIRQISYQYRIGYRTSATSSTTTWFNNGKYVTGDLWVKQEDDVPDEYGNTYSYYVKSRKWNHSTSQAVSVKNLSLDVTYYLVVEYKAKPTDVYDYIKNQPSQRDGVNLVDNSYYYTWQTYTITKDQSGENIAFIRRNFTTPTIAFNPSANPNNSGNIGASCMVYNHPLASVGMRLVKDGLPATKSDGSNTYWPLAALVAAKTTSIPIPTSYSYKSLTYKGPVNSWLASVTLDGGLNSNYFIYYMYDRPDEREAYGRLTGHDVSTAYKLPFIRFSRLVLDKNGDGDYQDAILSLQLDGCVDASGGSTFENPDYWYEWNVLLGQITDDAGSSNNVYSTHYIQCATSYFRKELVEYYSGLVLCKKFGYDNPGRTEPSKTMFSSGSDSEYTMQSNVIKLYITPSITFPIFYPISSTEFEVQVINETDASQYAEENVIVIRNQPAKADGYEAMYGIENYWQASYDGVNWITIATDDKLSEYLLDPSELSFYLDETSTSALVLKSSILSGYDEMYFRQSAVATVFSSTEQSSLYNFKRDGRWYLQEVADYHYTCKAVRTPVLTVEAIDADGKISEYEEEEICYGGEFFTKKLRWSADESFTDIKYSIYRLDGEKEVLVKSNVNEYTIPQLTSTTVYRLVGEASGVRGYSDVKFSVVDRPAIDLTQISSNQTIFTIDSTSGILTILSRGGNAYISINNALARDIYHYRKVVPYVEPELWPADFTDYSTDECIEYILLKGWDFVGETGADFDDVSPNALREYCKSKQNAENAEILSAALTENELANAWREITNPYNIDLGDESAQFYLIKSGYDELCVSDSVLIDISAVTPIVNNKISFTDVAYAGKDTVYIDAGSYIPSITSYTVTGGYGKPTTSDSYSYVYQWIFRYDDGVWQDLKRYTDNGRSTVSQTSVSLIDYTSKVVDRNIDLARVVISRIDADELTQYCDTSNILRVATEGYFDDVYVRILNDGACAGTVINVEVTESFDTSSYRLVCSSDDDRVNIAVDESNPKLIHVYDTREDFNLYIARENLKNGARSNQVTVPVSVIPARAAFSMIADGVEMNILDYDEDFIVSPGTLVQFIDESEGNNLVYDWSLQVQTWIDDEIEADKSSIRDPYCYLYNQGRNTVKLKIYSYGSNSYCTSEATANNIIVQGTAVTRSLEMPSGFVSDSAVELIQSRQKEQIDVYPTILGPADRTVHIRSNVEFLHYYLFDNTGRMLQQGTFEGMGDIHIQESASGFLILNVNGESFKILNQ